MKFSIFSLALTVFYLCAAPCYAANSTDAGTLYRHCSAALQLQKIRSEVYKFDPEYVSRLNHAALQCSTTLSITLEAVSYFDQETQEICLPANYNTSQFAQLMVKEIKENAHLLPLPQMQVMYETLEKYHACPSE